MFKRSQGQRRSSGGVLAPMTRRRLAHKHRKPRSRSKLMPVLLAGLGLAPPLIANLAPAAAPTAHPPPATLLSNWHPGGTDPAAPTSGASGGATCPPRPG